MVDVILKKWAWRSEVEQIKGKTVPVSGAELLAVEAILDWAVRHHIARDNANATNRLEAVRYSPLTASLMQARNLLEYVLELQVGKPAIRVPRLGRPAIPKEAPKPETEKPAETPEKTETKEVSEGVDKK